MKHLALLAALLLLVSGRTNAEVCGELGSSRAMTLPKRYVTGVREEPFYGSSYALIVGGINYLHYEPLPSIKDEMDDLAAGLAAQGFRVRKICNPTASGPGGLGEIEKFLADYDSPDARLLIFLAGHGWVDPKKRQGHYAAIDSPRDRAAPLEAAEKSLSSTQLISLLRSIKSKHVLVAVDACYSAAIFTTRSDAVVTNSFSTVHLEEIGKPARWFITAGSEDEKTPSPSIFAPALVLGLSGKADSIPRDGVVSATELAAYVRHVVANSTGQQTIPRWGHIPLEPAQLVSGGGEPMFRYDPEFEKSLNDNIRSPGVAYLSIQYSGHQRSAWPDPKYRITYFEKRADEGAVIEALDAGELPYLATTSMLPENYRTNGLACHPDAPAEVVRAAAKGLIENGVELRIIDQATKRLEERRHQLQLLHFGRVSGAGYRDITLDDLDKLDGCPNEFHFKS